MAFHPTKPMTIRDAFEIMTIKHRAAETTKDFSDYLDTVDNIMENLTAQGFTAKEISKALREFNNEVTVW